MEPPAKRRRQGSSPFNSSDPLGLEPETDDDTAPHHDHVETEDDGYQLAIKRMQASQKFQATFAHIFEKYSQNFDGIGDEIDMETGEIVVNNGHLSHMRHEADIGGGWTDNLAHDPIDIVDEDDGFVLEDFIDGFSDDDDEDEPQGAKHAGKEEGGPEPNKKNQDEEEVIREEPAAATEKNALVPASNAGALALPQNLQVGQVGNPASFFTNLYGSLSMGFMPALVPMSPGNTFPQMNNGAPLPANFPTPPNGQGGPFPFMFNPWATNGLLPPQSWGQMGASMPSPQSWGGQSNAPMLPQLPALPSPEKPKGERYNFPIQRGETSIWAPDSRQEDDNSPPKRRGRTPKSRNRKVKHIRSSPSGKKETSTNEDPTQANDTDHENRRVSGRVRKQTEYMGKISWLEVEKNTIEQSSRQQTTANSEDPCSSGEDELASEVGVSASSEPTQSSQSPENLEHVSKSNLGRVIPDSQDSATPPMSSAPQPSQSSQAKGEAVHPGVPAEEKQTSIFALSDDEAPIVHQKATTGGTANNSTKPTPEASSAKKVVDTTVNAPPEVQPTPEPLKKRPRGRPRKRPLDSPGDPPDPNQNANPPKRAGARCQREVKWLQKSISQSNNSTVPLESANEEEETAQMQARGSPKGLRSTQTRASPKPTLDVTNELPEHGHEPDPPTPAPNPPTIGEIPVPVTEQESLETQTPPKSPASTPPVEDETSTNNGADLPPLPTSEEAPAQLSPSTKEHTPVPNSVPNTPQKPTEASRPRPSKPQTPRHTSIRTSQAPSSRRSLLSLVSNQDSDSESDKDLDELGHSHSFRPSPFGPRSAGTSTRKTWRSSALTREIYRTPVKKRRDDPVSPSSVIKTPGGTVRTCGVDGYQCGRDFCFTCL